MSETLSMHQEFIKKLATILDRNLENEKFGVAELATEIGLSRSQLHRKLQEINGKSSSQFIREYRLEKAMKMLEANEATVSEVAYRVGFSSPSYFSRSFNNFYGHPPGEVKYQKSTAPPKKTFSKKLVNIFPVLILVGLIVIGKYFYQDAEISGEKNIAVLPFINDSSLDENMYFCNGIMTGIRDQLAKIPELNVVSRLSVEPYRNSTKPLKVVAQELNVNYVIEGKVQRIDNRAIISAELIQVNTNKVLWSERYDEDVSEIFAVQTRVIASITDNLETIISPKLNKELRTKPTQDLLAYEYYLKGEEYRFNANLALQNTEDWLELLNKSKLSYELAIERDSIFAEAYLGLGLSLFKKNKLYLLAGDSIDNVLPSIHKALQLKPNLEGAYLLQGHYYKLFKQDIKAETSFHKVLELNENNVLALTELIDINRIENDFNKLGINLKKLEKAARTKDDFFKLYNNYALLFHLIEHYDASDYYFNKVSEYGPDNYFNRSLLWSYITSQRIQMAIEYVNAFNTHEDNQDHNAHLAAFYARLGDSKRGLEYAEKSIEQIKVEDLRNVASMFIYIIYGHLLAETGQIEKAREMFEKQIFVFDQVLAERQIHTSPIIQFTYIQLYYYLGDYEKSYEYMNAFEASNGWNYKGLLSLAKHGIEFDPMRSDQQFQQFLENGKNQVDYIRKQITPYLPSRQSYSLN